MCHTKKKKENLFNMQSLDYPSSSLGASDVHTKYIWTIIAVFLAVLLITGIAFQTLIGSFRKDQETMEVIAESRQMWIGNIGLIPIVVSVILLGFITIGLRHLTKQLQSGVDRILRSMAEILVRLSSASDEVKQTVRLTSKSFI
jgi:hypothetical protein